MQQDTSSEAHKAEVLAFLNHKRKCRQKNDSYNFSFDSGNVSTAGHLIYPFFISFHPKRDTVLFWASLILLVPIIVFLITFYVFIYFFPQCSTSLAIRLSLLTGGNVSWYPLAAYLNHLSQFSKMVSAGAGAVDFPSSHFSRPSHIVKSVSTPTLELDNGLKSVLPLMMK
eukprot:gnl/Dysnectes_brevis/4690_a6423_793.p1 GENE.gnl/Dysnectes_brevis/4690_a6423_793~~gnl/Dysnectes_brevis/4690_a6423_793.p1  ORF type:complete len:183 (+),score=1.67 gnl/Dysnectes_brevis/4690_a6423_793:42-551(+)